MSAVCISINGNSLSLGSEPFSFEKLFTIRYLDPETKKQEEELQKSFSSRYEAFSWAWDYANGRPFTVRPASKVPA
ncbi:MAG: hypothetical protein J6P72_08345 [Firmicutes bacterium]|nr:hypothetical protein [Bacillota bacterium]